MMRAIGLSIGFILFLFPSCLVITQSTYTNTLPAMDNLRVDECEISVHAWLSYYSYILRTEGKDSAAKVLPDRNAVRPEVWIYITHPSPDSSNLVNISTGEPLGYFYARCDNFIRYDKKHFPSVGCPFLYVPITGISHEQAVAFCGWRSLVAGKGKVQYRLPTRAEWEAIAFRGLSESEQLTRQNDSIKNGKCAFYNYKLTSSCSDTSAFLLKNPSTVHIGSYFPNGIKTYDLFGNVSEMVHEKGIAKGGNYQLYAAQCHIDSVQVYGKPEPWLGFRCVAEKKPDR